MFIDPQKKYKSTDKIGYIGCKQYIDTIIHHSIVIFIKRIDEAVKTGNDG